MIESYQHGDVSDMLFKHFVKMTEEQQRAVNFASQNQRPPQKPMGPMSAKKLRAGVDSIIGAPQSSNSGNQTERLNALRPEPKPQPQTSFDSSMFNLPQAKGPQLPQGAPKGTQMISGQADYTKVAPTNSPEKEASGAKSEFGGSTFDSEGFRDMFGQDAVNTPYQNKRLKTGGFARNIADSAMDRLTAARRGQNPFSSKGAAAGQRQRLGIDQTQQADFVSRQSAALADEKTARAQGKKDARLASVMSRAPGAAGLPGGRAQQEAITAATTEEPVQPSTATPSQASATEAQSTQSASPAPEESASDEKPQTGAPLTTGGSGGVKIPGWRGAANYAMKNPLKTGLMGGLPAAVGIMGGAAEAGINLFNQGRQAFQNFQNQNPNLKRASYDMIEYNPELAMLMKSHTHMRQLRDARSTEVIRYAYG